jgi:hypothetical protein
MAVAGDAYADDDGVELPFAYARGASELDARNEAQLHGSWLQLSGRSTRQRFRHGGLASASELVSRSTLAP